MISSLLINFVCPNSSLGSAFSIGADPPELSHGSKEVGLIVTHFLGSLLFTVAKAFPAYIGLKKVSADIIFVTSLICEAVSYTHLTLPTICSV